MKIKELLMAVTVVVFVAGSTLFASRSNNEKVFRSLVATKMALADLTKVVQSEPGTVLEDVDQIEDVLQLKSLFKEGFAEFKEVSEGADNEQVKELFAKVECHLTLAFFNGPQEKAAEMVVKMANYIGTELKPTYDEYRGKVPNASAIEKEVAFSASAIGGSSQSAANTKESLEKKPGMEQLTLLGTVLGECKSGPYLGQAVKIPNASQKGSKVEQQQQQSAQKAQSEKKPQRQAEWIRQPGRRNGTLNRAQMKQVQLALSNKEAVVLLPSSKNNKGKTYYIKASEKPQYFGRQGMLRIGGRKLIQRALYKGYRVVVDNHAL